MKYRISASKFAPACLTVLLLLSVITHAASMTIASTDHLPLGDWSYDAMMSLASDGLVPDTAARVFQGDRLFDRIEMAQMVASVVKSATADRLDLNQVVLIGQLVTEFRPELLKAAPDTIAQWDNVGKEAPRGRTLAMGYLNGLLEADNHGESKTDVPYRVTGLTNLNDGTFGYLTFAGKEDRFFHRINNGRFVDKVAIRTTRPNYSLSAGREYLNWGPSYTGSLILSDNSTDLWQVRGSKDVNLGKFFGRIKITQFASAYEDHQNIYLFGRRYEKWLGDSLHMGISETAELSEAPNPLILVMPFYLYQHIFKEIDPAFNSLYALDMTYQTKKGQEAYGEFLVDDLTAPESLGAGFDRPKKTGLTLGMYLPKVIMGDKLSTFRAEYVTIDPLTYSATRPITHPELSYTHNGRIIGSSFGPNSKSVYLRGEQQLSNKLNVIAEYLNQTQNKVGNPAITERREVSLRTSYDITPDKSVSLRVTPYKLMPPGSPEISSTEYQARISFAF